MQKERRKNKNQHYLQSIANKTNKESIQYEKNRNRIGNRLGIDHQRHLLNVKNISMKARQVSVRTAYLCHLFNMCIECFNIQEITQMINSYSVLSYVQNNVFGVRKIALNVNSYSISIFLSIFSILSIRVSFAALQRWH